MTGGMSLLLKSLMSNILQQKVSHDCAPFSTDSIAVKSGTPSFPRPRNVDRLYLVVDLTAPRASLPTRRNHVKAVNLRQNI